MSDQNAYIITKEDLEVILNVVRRLPWNDANIVMARVKDLTIVKIKKEDDNQKELFKNKFSGTNNRNEKEKPKEVLPPSVTTDKNWGGDGTPVY